MDAALDTRRLDILVSIAKRLPLQALVKFAQVSAETNFAATEAWETWEHACRAIGTRRTFSDKCWMDVYARALRQNAYRFVDASVHWSHVNEPPAWFKASLRAAHGSECCFGTTTFKIFVRGDYQVVNATCIRDGQVWATISSTGEFWTFTDAFLTLRKTDCLPLASFLQSNRDRLRHSIESDATLQEKVRCKPSAASRIPAASPERIKKERSLTFSTLKNTKTRQQPKRSFRTYAHAHGTPSIGRVAASKKIASKKIGQRATVGMLEAAFVF